MKHRASGGDQHHAGHADDGDVRTRLGDGVAVGIGLLQCGDRVGEGLLRGVDVSWVALSSARTLWALARASRTAWADFFV